MKGVYIDPKEILENNFTSEDIKFYLRSLGPATCGMLLIAIFSVVFTYIKADGDISGAMGMVAFVVLILGACGVKLYSTRSKGNKRLKAMIDKYGRENLNMDLRDPYNEVFMLHPEKLETYVIVSSRYLYFSREGVFALDDIQQAYIEMYDNTSQNKAGESNVRPYDHSNKNVRETVRFCKPAYVITKQGQSERFLVALEQDQLNQLSELFATLGR